MGNLSELERNNLLDLFQNNDFEKAFKTIREYLKSNDRTQYYTLIIDIVKIDIINKDKKYTFTIEYLDNILSPDYKFDLSFFKKIEEHAKRKNSGSEYFHLKELLEDAKRIDMDIEKKDILYDYIDYLSKKDEQDPTRLTAIKVVEDTYKKLLDGEGIVVLPSKYSTKKEAIKNECKRYIDIRSFIILDNRDKERIVLRYKDPLHFPIDFTAKTTEGKEALREHDYKKAEQIFLFLISHGNPKFFVYRLLALAYAGLGEYKKALELFTITEHLAREEGMDPKCEDVKNRVIKRYIDSEKSLNKMKDMIGNACKEEGISYNELLEGLQYAKIDVNIGTLLQISLYEVDTFKYIVDVSRKALECKESGKPYEEFGDSQNISFKDFIAEIRRENSERTKEKNNGFKPYVYIKTREFTSGYDVNNFGITNFDEVAAFIQESGLDVETAAEEFGFTPRQINLIRLIYAREYYSQGYYEKGDEFLKAVEQDKEKDPAIKKAILEMHKQKKYYINRNTDEHRVLSLTLKPRKKKKN